jgi:3-dehydroquinate synthase
LFHPVILLAGRNGSQGAVKSLYSDFMSSSSRSFSFGPHTSTVTFGPLADAFSDETGGDLIVCDKNTVGFSKDSEIPSLVLDAGERSKLWPSIEGILNKAVSLELGRDCRFVGLGGGVVCDMTAFASSVYMRGCKISLVPTTLLAMVDASIGGKTGIDFAGYKNLVGSFYPADRIHISVDTLSTLPEREYKSGLGEVMKHALLGAEDLLDILEDQPGRVAARDPSVIEACISRSLDIKGDIVEQDLVESGVRAHLNFGHTFAHALESVAGFGVFSHGEAVAWGIIRALKAGVLAGVTDAAYAERVHALFQQYEYRTGALPEGITADSILQAMKRDKKRQRGNLRFILQRGFGETIVTTLDEEVVRTVLTEN